MKKKYGYHENTSTVGNSTKDAIKFSKPTSFGKDLFTTNTKDSYLEKIVNTINEASENIVHPQQLYLVRTTGMIYAIVLVLILGNFVFSYGKVTKRYMSPLNDGFSVLTIDRKDNNKENTVYGFLPYWMLEEADNLHLDKLTDISYFGLRLDSDGSIRKIDSEGLTESGYNQWKNNEKLDDLIQKSKFGNINFEVTILSHEDSVNDQILSCGERCWENLKNDLIIEMDSKGIKNINLDFEYVSGPEIDNADVQYEKLVEYLNKELDKVYGDSIVTVSTFADSAVKERITNPKNMAQVADRLFIMAYDFHYTGSGKAGPVAPINRVAEHTSYDVNSMIKDYLKQVPPKKLILGVPYYGYNWLTDTQEAYATRIDGNDIMGYSISQPYTSVIETILDVKPDIKWDNRAKVPYFYYTSLETGFNRVVYFENTESLRIKYNLIKAYDLAGVGIWALGYDGGYQELWELIAAEFH